MSTTSIAQDVDALWAGLPSRRTFTTEYRRRIVTEYEQAPTGSKGHVLRREGLYDRSCSTLPTPNTLNDSPDDRAHPDSRR